MVLMCRHLGEESQSASPPPQRPKELQVFLHLSGTIESVLTGSITTWFGYSTREGLPGSAEGDSVSRTHHQMVNSELDEAFTPGGAGQGLRGSLKTSLSPTTDPSVCCVRRDVTAA